MFYGVIYLINNLCRVTSYEDFYNSNSHELIEKDFEKIWKDILSGKKIKKADVIAKADIGYTYFYDILRGEKHPSRDTLIKLCLAMELSVDETQKVLYIYDWAYLYPNVKRDSIILFAIHNTLTTQQTNSLLESYNQRPLKAHK